MGNPTVSHRGGWYYLVDGLRAPRSASLYSRFSREELEGRFLGLMALPGSERVKGTAACQESSNRAQAYGAVCCEARAIWLKLDCLNPNLQQMQVVHPPERRPIPAPISCTGMCWPAGATFGIWGDAQ
jgi:hypothetical protein